jgi:hypothetical protein
MIAEIVPDLLLMFTAVILLIICRIFDRKD